jgi:hypothetical protein
LKIVALASGFTGKADLKMIDKWIVDNDPHPGRSEAIRKRLEPGSTLKTRAKSPSAVRADRVKEPVTKAVEKFPDPSDLQSVGLGLSKSAPTERLIAARAFVSAQSKCRRKK